MGKTVEEYLQPFIWATIGRSRALLRDFKDIPTLLEFSYDEDDDCFVIQAEGLEKEFRFSGCGARELGAWETVRRCEDYARRKAMRGFATQEREG